MLIENIIFTDVAEKHFTFYTPDSLDEVHYKLAAWQNKRGWFNRLRMKILVRREPEGIISYQLHRSNRNFEVHIWGSIRPYDKQTLIVSGDVEASLQKTLFAVMVLCAFGIVFLLNTSSFFGAFAIGTGIFMLFFNTIRMRRIRDNMLNKLYKALT